NGAGSADGDARCGDARQRRLSARPLRQARPEIPHLARLGWVGRPDSDAIEDVTMTIRHLTGFARAWSLIPAAAITLCLLAPARAQQTFRTADAAAWGRAAAVKSGSEKDILKVLGSRGRDIVSSGDDVADKESRERFTAAWDAKPSIKTEGDKKAVMILG